jgi:hypothetical protein
MTTKVIPYSFWTMKKNFVIVNIHHEEYPLKINGQMVKGNVRVFFEVFVTSQIGEKLHYSNEDCIVPLKNFEQFDGYTDRLGDSPILLTPTHAEHLESLRKLYINLLTSEIGALGVTFNGRTVEYAR